MKSIIKVFVFASLLLMSNLAKSGVSGPPVAPVKDCEKIKMEIDDLRRKIAAQKNEAARFAKIPSPVAKQRMLSCNKIMQQLQVDKAAAQNRLMQCTGSNEKYKNAQQLEKKAAADKAAASKAAAGKPTSTKSQAQIDAQEKRANLNANRARTDELQAKRQADKITKENQERLKNNKLNSELDKAGLAADKQQDLVKLTEAQRKAQVKANKPASDKANKEGIEREAAANQAAAAKARKLKEEKEFKSASPMKKLWLKSGQTYESIHASKDKRLWNEFKKHVTNVEHSPEQVLYIEAMDNKKSLSSIYSEFIKDGSIHEINGDNQGLKNIRAGIAINPKGLSEGSFNRVDFMLAYDKEAAQVKTDSFTRWASKMKSMK